jgi:hypothetical protein
MLLDRRDDVSVVVDAELIGHGQQQRVGLRDSLVLSELRDENVGLCRIPAYGTASSLSCGLQPAFFDHRFRAGEASRSISTFAGCDLLDFT